MEVLCHIENQKMLSDFERGLLALLDRSLCNFNQGVPATIENVTADSNGLSIVVLYNMMYV